MQVFEIDREQCTGCMECLTHCPSNAISIGAEGILVDAQRCVSCGSCFRPTLINSFTCPTLINSFT